MSSMTELTKSEAEELVEAFSLFDLDRDGRISARELGPVMRALGQNPTETAIWEMLKSIGKSEKEFLDFDEYKNLIASHVIPPDEVERRLVEAFRFFDKDNSGTISVRELKRILTMYGETITEHEASEILKDLDKDNDGKLLYSEISSFLCKRMMLE